MTQLDKMFEPLFDQLQAELERQRQLHTSAFGKDNAQEIIDAAENNRQKLDCWQSLLQDIRCEMIESGLFFSDLEPSETGHIYRVSGDNLTTITPYARPISVTVLGQFKSIRYWKDMLLFVCEVLYGQQPNKFVDIENEPILQGRNRSYISTDKNKLRKPMQIGDSPYYIEVNLSQAYCKKITYLLLAIFGYNQSDIHIEEIYRDKKDQNNQKGINVPQINNEKLKIGQRAKSALGRLITGGSLSPEELKLLCELDYSKVTFGAYIPVLRFIPYGVTADQSRRDKHGRARYYKEVYCINNDRYLISSQWYEKQYPQLEEYLAQYGE